jgi:hypothetical protein
MLLNHLIKKALTFPNERGRFVYVAPYLKQAKTLSWDYLKHYCNAIPNRTYHESELKVSFPNGSQIRLFGADNPDALRGIYVDGCVLDEYATTDPVVFSSILRPALSDRNGWCVFSGTPNGKNHFYDILARAREDSEWYHTILRASESCILSAEELADAKRVMTDDEYEREFECSFDSIIGKRIYPEWNSRVHISDEPLLPVRPVQVISGWDNTGLSPAINLSYFTADGQWRIFKEFCFFDTGIMDATETLVTWCNRNLPRGCTFEHYGDPAGRNRDSNKMSPRDYITIKGRELGNEIYLIDGIQTWKARREAVANRLTKMVNGKPAIIVDPGCRMLIEGFEGGYAYRELANLPGQYAEEAVKNQYSHIHDSLQYPATRLFTQYSGNRTIDGSLVDEDWDEDVGNSYTYQGKSVYGGY